MKNYQHAYRRFLENHQARGVLHFAAHSHHFWPDCTREAQLQYWDNSARDSDGKWGPIFSNTLTESRRYLQRLLGLKSAHTLTFAPNTHEFVLRLLSCLEPGPSGKSPRVVTTDSEFHSFTRQCKRLEESGELQVTRVPVFPIESFVERFVATCLREDPDLVFFSHVFFNSGWALPNLDALVNAIASTRALIAIDGYHAFCAIPIDLSAIESRIFYLAGGYKYAQAGEGACFLHVPSDCELRPKNTGWWADFAHLDGAPSPRIQYATDANRFAGSTFDPSGWYRFNAVMEWWDQDGITPEVVHSHVLELQTRWLNALKEQSRDRKTLLDPDSLLLDPTAAPAPTIGHFLTFQIPHAAEVCAQLAERGVITDSRQDRLRFGMGLYHTALEIEQLLERLR